jgi:hypothetical protein
VKRRFAAIALIALLAGLAGCRMAHKGMSVDRAEAGHYQYSVALRTSKAILGGSPGPRQGSSNRHIAVRHKLAMLSDENSLPRSWQSVIDFCKTIQCEVVVSSLAARTRDFSAARKHHDARCS